MSMISKLHAMHHVDEMSDAAAAGLMRLIDPERVGPLDAGEIAAIASSPVLRPAVEALARQFGLVAWRRMQAGESSQIEAWFAEMRPEIRAIAEGRER